MNTLDIVKKLKEETENLPDVIAPLTTSGQQEINVKIGTHPYRFTVNTTTPGWYILKPTSSTTACVLNGATSRQVGMCLKSSPDITMITARRLSSTSWLVYPFNVSDAKSKGFNPEPYICKLIDRQLRPFSTINCAIWGKDLIFNPRIVRPPVLKLLRDLESGISEPVKTRGVQPEFYTVYNLLTEELEKARRSTTDFKIKEAVEYLGGQLIGYTEIGEGYEVRWRDTETGETYSCRVKDNLRLVSAGICLSDLENRQTLTSTIAVMKMERDDYY